MVETQTNPPLFRAKRLGVRLTTAAGSTEILSDIDLEVRPGEFLVLVGRSGTGKTTLLRALAGLVETTGELEFDGNPLTKPSSSAVMVFQDYGHALLPWRTVARNVSLGLEGRMSRAEREERTHEALRMTGLETRASEYPWRLSGGMQQRVQIARALALRPRVLLMDEPFGALDAITKSALQDQLLQVQAETGATIVFITHDVDEAVYLSDRVLVIHSTPGTVDAPIETGLPHPRHQITTKELPRYLEVRHMLGEALHSGY